MGKGKGKKTKKQHTTEAEERASSSTSTQQTTQQQQPQGPMPQQQPQGPTPQQQLQGPRLQQQPQGPRPQQQPQGPRPQQHQGPRPQQQPQGPRPQQQPQGPRPQQHQGPRPQQQPQGPRPQQQPQGPRPQQQPQGPRPQQQPPWIMSQQLPGSLPQVPQWTRPQRQPRGPRPQQQPQGPRPQQQPQGPRPQQQPQGPRPQQQPQGPRPQQQPPWIMSQQLPGSLPQVPQWTRPQRQPQGPMPQQQPQGPMSQQQPQEPMPLQQPPEPVPQQQPQGPMLLQQPQGQRPQQQQPQEPMPQQQPQGPGPQQPQEPVPQQQQQPQEPMPQQQQPQEPKPQQSQEQRQKKRPPGPKSKQQPTQQAGPSMDIPKLEKLHVFPDMDSKAIALQIPKRQDPNKAGTRGRKITVQTNMMKLIFSKNFQTNAVQYDITFDPDKPKFLMRAAFEKFRQINFPTRYPAFDGKKNVFSANNLPFGDEITGECEIYDKERERNKTFIISMKKVQEIDLSWLPFVKAGLEETERTQIAVQAIDVILRHGPSSFCVTVGRSLFYEPDERPRSLTGGLDLWIGAFQSTVLGWKPYLNVDVSHKGFPSAKNVIDILKDLCLNVREGDRPLDSNDIQRNKDKIKKFLKGLKVCYQLPGQPSSKRTHRVNDIVECPRNNKFEKSAGVKCSVEEYFRKEKNYTIRYPLLPCLWVGPTNKQIHVPAELCTILAGQVTQKKMSEEQTSTMIKYAATNTDDRKQKILKAFDALKLSENKSMSNEFHLSVCGELETVPARVLSAPNLEYQKINVNVSKGVWRAAKFLNAITLEDYKWTILSLDDRFIRVPQLHDLSEQLLRAGEGLGMQLGKPLTPFKTFNTRQFPMIEGYLKEQKGLGLRLVIVIIPNAPEAYSQVKQLSELKIGILTQCIKSKTMSRLSPSTIGNILLKINAKLNGVNHTIAKEIKPKLMYRPFILIGADVTHPSPDARDIPSIAAVAASHDSSGFKYNIEIRLQPARKEIILDLKEIIHKQFIFFYQQNRCKPERVIVYRDGVSEGELTKVMCYELKAIQNAFLSLEKDGKYNPPITFLVVQKRHHVRLFPTNRKDSDDRNYNVQAGTIVDTHITHPSQIDFYLVSHASIQGTARPTKYRCIWNDNKLTEDEIEELTYYLCHMFSRCTRSVSYPAPTYYAHLAAFRARALIYNQFIDMDNLRKEQNKIALKMDMKEAPMFFI